MIKPKRFLLHAFFLVLGAVISLVIGETVVARIRPQLIYRKAKAVTPDCFVPDSVSPFSLRKGHTCIVSNTEERIEVPVHINSLGYRGQDFSSAKSEGTKRTLMLGDSFVFGYLVPDDQTIAAHVERQLNTSSDRHHEVINAGFHAGYSPDSYYAYLADRGMELAPDTVMLGLFSYNDVSDLSENEWISLDTSGLPKVVRSRWREVFEGEFLYRQIDPSYKIPILRESHLFHLVFNFLKPRFSALGVASLDTPKGEKLRGCTLTSACIDLFSEEEDRLYRVIRGMNRLVTDRGARFLVFIIPVDYQIYPFAFDKYQFAERLDPDHPDFLNTRIATNLEQDSIEVFDLYPALKANKEAGGKYPYYLHDGHFSPIGTAMVATTIADYLTGEANMIEATGSTVVNR